MYEAADGDYYVDGIDLVVPLQRDVKAGYQFRLTLANAEWFFRANAYTDEASLTIDELNNFYGDDGRSTTEKKKTTGFYSGHA
jgi:hypothetical protein